MEAAEASHHSLAPGDREYLPVTLLKEYAYCPTLATLKAATIWEPETSSMRYAKSIEPRLETLTSRLGLEGYRVVRSLRVYSRRLGLRGVLDAALVSEREAIPVEAKLRVTPRTLYTRAHHILAQLVAYTIALEETLRRPSWRAAVISLEDDGAWLIRVKPWMRTWVERLARELHETLREGKTPPPTAHRQRCKACWYRSICPHA